MTLRVNGQTPLWVGARELLRLRGDDFRRRLAIVLRAFEPEAIHDLRVSSRRQREGLILFAPCYPAKGVTSQLKRTRKVTRLLGEIRNRDEAMLFFSALRSELESSCRSALDPLLASFEQDRAGELQRLERGLRRFAGADMARQYRQLADFPELFAPFSPAVDPFMSLEDFSRKALRSRLADLLQLVPAARLAENVAEQHQLRIAVKHFRYRLEILSCLFSDSYGVVHAVVKAYQELLGKMHDLDVFATICQEARFPLPAAAVIQEAIATKRAMFFAQFSSMLGRLPLAEMGSRLGIGLEVGGGSPP